MNCERKYVRVRKANAALPKTFLSSSASAVSLSSVPRLIKSEPDDELSGTNHRATTVNATQDEEQIILNRVPCGGPIELLTSYPGYAGNIDGIRKHFSSTTILNGSAVTEQLQYANSGCKSESIVVMPLDTEPESPTDDTIPDDLTHSIRVGTDYSQLISSGLLHKEMDDSYVITPELVNSCYLSGDNSSLLGIKPTKSIQRTITLPSRSSWLTKKLNKAEKITSVVKTVITGTGKRGLIRFGRSRMIADTHTCIPVSEFKAQLNDTSDISGKFDIAPPTKKEMHVLNTKGVNKLFANPGRRLSTRCMHLFVRHLTMKQTQVEVTYNDMPLQPVGFTPEVDPTTIKRITRKRRYPEAEEYQRKLYNSQVAMSFLTNVDSTIEESQADFIQEVTVPDSDCQDNIVQFELMEDSNNEANSSESNVTYAHGLVTDDVGLLEVEVEQVLQDDLLESESQLQDNLLEMQTDEDFLESQEHEERLLSSQEQMDESVLGTQDDYMTTDTILLETGGEEFIGAETELLDHDESNMKPTILMVHDSAQVDEYNQFSQQNIEVLLAAAERNGINRGSIHQVIICQAEDGSDQATFLSSTGQIMLMPTDPLSDATTETVMTT